MLCLNFTQYFHYLRSARGCIFRLPTICQRPRVVPPPSQQQSAVESRRRRRRRRRGRTGAAPATRPLVGERALCGRRLPATGAGLAGDARGLPAAQPTDDAAGHSRSLLPQPTLCCRRTRTWRRRWLRRWLHKTGHGESAEGRFGDKPEAGLGIDKVFVENETRTIIKRL